MATTTHTLETTWPSGEADLSVEIGFRFTPGYPGDRVDPPCPDEAEVMSVHFVVRGERKPAATATIQAISESDSVYQAMIALAKDERQPDPDADRDFRRDAFEAALP